MRTNNTVCLEAVSTYLLLGTRWKTHFQLKCEERSRRYLCKQSVVFLPNEVRSQISSVSKLNKVLKYFLHGRVWIRNAAGGWPNFYIISKLQKSLSFWSSTRRNRRKTAILIMSNKWKPLYNSKRLIFKIKGKKHITAAFQKQKSTFEHKLCMHSFKIISSESVWEFHLRI